jgi:hypothetical protein
MCRDEGSLRVQCVAKGSAGSKSLRTPGLKEFLTMMMLENYSSETLASTHKITERHIIEDRNAEEKQ